MKRIKYSNKEAAHRCYMITNMLHRIQNEINNIYYNNKTSTTIADAVDANIFIVNIILKVNKMKEELLTMDNNDE